MALQRIGTIHETAVKYHIPTEHIPTELLGVPGYVNTRLRTTLGYAKCVRGRRSIELHAAVAADPQQGRETLAHEIAHHVAGISVGHSAGWSVIARALGASGERCATEQAARSVGIERKRRAKRVVARCGRCGYEVIRAKALPHARVFSHLRCGGQIESVS